MTLATVNIYISSYWWLQDWFRSSANYL